jgi:hypothetical protein
MSHFLFNQLPELYTTLERDDAFPIQYIGANVPQAWAAGSAFMLTQAILGFLPDAPRDKLYIDPWLPSWSVGDGSSIEDCDAMVSPILPPHRFRILVSRWTKMRLNPL